MSDTIAVYRAEGWITEERDLDYDRILDHARAHGLLPIRSERDAIAAAEGAYGWGSGGLRMGFTTVRQLGNWGWFTGWAPEAADRDEGES